MSKFHTTVSRRDFMKGLGLAGIGLGVAPTFNDMDEVVGSSVGLGKKPWWVKERDFKNPTVDLDWSRYQPVDPRVARTHGPSNVGSYYNDYALQVQKSFNPNFNSDTTRNPYPDILENGYQVKNIRDIALQIGANHGRHANPDFAYIPKGVKTPEELGVSKWQGSPEENLQMLRTAFTFFGASDVGAVEMDPDLRKLIWACDNNGKPHVFEDVDEPYETATKKVIPNRYTTMIVWTAIQPYELTMTSPSSAGQAAKRITYNRMASMVLCMHAFLYGIGHRAVAGYSGDLAAANAFGALAGMGEHSRSSNVLTTPLQGNLLRGMNRILTDIPVAPTKPIDSGIFTFCHTCKTCATHCPYGGLPMGDPSWEHESYQPGGYRGWRLIVPNCPACEACLATCPFSTAGYSMIHDFVRVTVATTPVLNGFFATMDAQFGYGPKDPEDWWNNNNRPMYGLEPNLVMQKG